MRSVCVFAGSSLGNRAQYASAAATLGETVARRRMRLVYGGSSIGLMGVVADAALGAGGEVVGVIPRHLGGQEITHRALSELHVTETMHARKALMAELADGFVALPGGLGTLEEFVEVLTWAQLGLHRKPCALLDVSAYFAPLLRLLNHAVGEGFVTEANRELVLTDSDAERLLTRMESWKPPANVAVWLPQDAP